MAYATYADVVPFLPAGGLPNPARSATGNASGDYIECEGHGLADSATIVFRAEVGGALPTGLTAGTTYYVKAVTGSTSRFQVSATAGGAAINLTTDGSNFVFVSPLPWSTWLDWGARQVDSFLPAHVVPLVAPYPEIAVTANAELAAVRGLMSTAGSDIDLGAKLDQIATRLQRWAKSLPVRGATKSTQSPVNLAVTASAGATDPRGWATRGNDVLP